MSSKQLFVMCGAPGTGKSTLLNYIEKNFNISISEVSARPFLPPDTDYVNSLNTVSQILITQNRFTSFLEQAINNKPTVFSRAPLDSLAFERVLQKAPFLEELLKRQIEITKPILQYLYIPVEFPMSEQTDTVRGTNSEIQIQVDGQIQRALKEHNIDYINLGGSLEFRYAKLDKLLKDYRK
jgi:predicted ATPase